MCAGRGEDRCCQVLQALADRTRLRILKLLRGSELCVTEIAAHFEMTQPSISHHLDVLKRSGLVVSEKRGREVYYSYAGDRIVECCGAQFRLLDVLLRHEREE